MTAPDPPNSKPTLNKRRIAKVAATLGLAIALFVARGYLNKSPLDRAMAVTGVGLPKNPGGAYAFWWISPDRGIYAGYDNGGNCQLRYVDAIKGIADSHSDDLARRLRRKVQDIPSMVRPSPDGKLLLCSWVNPQLFQPLQNGSKRPPEYLTSLVSLDGSTKAQSLSPAYNLVWFDDSSGWIERDDQGRLYEVKLHPDNNITRQPTGGRSYSRIHSLLSDRKLVLFDIKYQRTGSPECRVQKISIHENAPKPVGSPIPVPTDGDVSDLSLSPDGSRIVWSIDKSRRDWTSVFPRRLSDLIGKREVINSEIWLTNIEGSNKTLLGSESWMKIHERSHEFRWSPDSRRISFLRSGKVWIMDVPNP